MRYGSRVIFLKQVNKILQILLWSISLLVLFISMFSFLGVLSPVIDIFSHFRWQYTLLLVLLALLLLCSGRRKFAAIMFIGVLANAVCLLTLFVPESSNGSSKATEDLSILNMNLQYGNQNYELVDKAIRNCSPDIITLQELTPAMSDHLESTLKSDYPYHCIVPRTDPYGIGLFSKRKLVHVDENPLKLPLNLVIQCDIQIDSKLISVLPVHVCGPTSSVGCELDKSIADNLAKFRAEDPDRSVILIGDMNSTPWSNIFRQLKNSERFRDSERGFGLQCSWPVGVPLLSIPIDHCLYTRDWSCKLRQLAGSAGSDHYPLFVRLVLNKNSHTS